MEPEMIYRSPPDLPRWVHCDKCGVRIDQGEKARNGGECDECDEDRRRIEEAVE